MNTRTHFTCLLLTCALTQLALADNWEPLTGADTLREFVSGAVAEITLKPDVVAVGTYHADGTAQIEAWNETFEKRKSGHPLRRESQDIQKRKSQRKSEKVRTSM